MDAQALLHKAMLTSAFYPDENGPVTFTETHISRLYFTSRHVYKIKKALNLGFVDFSSLAQRHQYCLEEIRLNRRLCPQTYLGVLPIYFGEKGYQLKGPGEIQEYTVLMKRLPEDRMLDRQINIKDPHLEEDMAPLGRLRLLTNPAFSDAGFVFLVFLSHREFLYRLGKDGLEWSKDSPYCVTDRVENPPK